MRPEYGTVGINGLKLHDNGEEKKKERKKKRKNNNFRDRVFLFGQVSTL